MNDLTLENPSVEHLMAMGDGLARAAAYQLAEGIYQVALKRAQPRQRRALEVRLGLVRAPGTRTTSHLRVLAELETQSNSVFVGDGLATWLKTIPFLQDRRFVEIANRHAHLLPIANWHWNLQVVLWAVQEAAAIDGDLIELGVFKGHSTRFAADYVDFGTWSKRWFLYDTFDGIPDDQLDPGWADANEAAYRGFFSLEEVQTRFADLPNIEIIKGRVPEILAERCPERIAFAHIDLNNSTAEIQALDFIFDRISPGGLIVFDDYGWAVSRAQHDAENAWFAERGLRILPLPTGQGLFVKRPA